MEELRFEGMLCGRHACAEKEYRGGRKEKERVWRREEPRERRGGNGFCKVVGYIANQWSLLVLGVN